MQTFLCIYTASFHLVKNEKAVLIAHEATKYTDDYGEKCSGIQLFNFFRNMRRIYTEQTKAASKSGAAGPTLFKRTKEKTGPLIDKIKEVFQQDMRQVIRRNRCNKQTSKTVIIYFIW